jgi:predicted RNase H-like HicB family nuclease
MAYRHPLRAHHHRGLLGKEYIMKAVYPVIITEINHDTIPYLVYVPDFDAMTQGKDLEDAILMAEDIIALSGVDIEDSGKPIPAPSKASDFDLYRKKLKNTSVRRNVSLPAWLDAEASKAGINVSAVLQSALKRELQLEG